MEAGQGDRLLHHVRWRRLDPGGGRLAEVEAGPLTQARKAPSEGLVALELTVDGGHQ